MSVTDYILIAALLAGFTSVWVGSRAAVVLISSLALTAILPYNIVVWYAIDLIAIVLLPQRPPTHKDFFIIILFIPCWAVYPFDTVWATDVTNIAVSLQLALTLPWNKLLIDAGAAAQTKSTWSGFDLKKVGQARA